MVTLQVNENVYKVHDTVPDTELVLNRYFHVYHVCECYCLVFMNNHNNNNVRFFGAIVNSSGTYLYSYKMCIPTSCLKVPGAWRGLCPPL